MKIPRLVYLVAQIHVIVDRVFRVIQNISEVIFALSKFMLELSKSVMRGNLKAWARNLIWLLTWRNKQ
jgi:hypothetical protein